MNTYVVEERNRVDKFVTTRLTEYSRAALAKLYDMACVEINGHRAKVGQVVRAGDTVTVDLSPLTRPQEVVELPILYEDSDVLVVNKPIGIISHARGRYWYEPSVASFLRHHVSNVVSHDSSNDRTGIVHRLDRATSGIMICGKNTEATKFLQKQFADRSVKKTYIALVDKALDPEEAIIDAPIARNLAKPTTFLVHASGKSAQTKYTTTAHLKNGLSQIKMTPLTGRTHQLRVHLSWRGSPIVGDEIYGGKKATRLMLHAHQLQITLPSGVNKIFEAPLPEAFC
jgi:23S rRNA pseudouridine1911/1915/1917 synthase